MRNSIAFCNSMFADRRGMAASSFLAAAAASVIKGSFVEKLRVTESEDSLVLEIRTCLNRSLSLVSTCLKRSLSLVSTCLKRSLSPVGTCLKRSSSLSLFLFSVAALSSSFHKSFLLIASPSFSCEPVRFHCGSFPVVSSLFFRFRVVRFF